MKLGLANDLGLPVPRSLRGAARVLRDNVSHAGAIQELAVEFGKLSEIGQPFLRNRVELPLWVCLILRSAYVRPAQFSNSSQSASRLLFRPVGSKSFDVSDVLRKAGVT